jgi:hypothetical protein
MDKLANPYRIKDSGLKRTGMASKKHISRIQSAKVMPIIQVISL